jgi:hypothetical protein
MDLVVFSIVDDREVSMDDINSMEVWDESLSSEREKKFISVNNERIEEL